jgi:zinc transport system substrate-binding protein
LPYRIEGIWGGGEKYGGHESRDERSRRAADPHFWLDPLRVRKAVSKIVQTLSEIDRPNVARYRANGDALARRLTSLHDRLEEKTSPVRRIPYLVFHDAYQYFETLYGLNALGTVKRDPEYRPGARHLAAIQQMVARGNLRCIFREPQFEPSLLDMISAQGALRVAVLDPLGAALEPGPEAYFTLLENMADNLTACLGAGTG